jgi:hypothetical protein
VNFIPISEGGVALFLLVVCPTLFLELIVCRSAVFCLKSLRVGLLSQDMQWEGAFTFSLLPSLIAFDFSTIYDNLFTMKDYFSILKSSVPPQCTEGLIIRVQPNIYIEKTEHFWTASHLVEQRGRLNKGYNTQEVWKIQPSFAGVYCVFSGLRDKPPWQDFPSNQSVIKELVKCKTKQSFQRSFSASRGPHLIPGELTAHNRARLSVSRPPKGAY